MGGDGLVAVPEDRNEVGTVAEIISSVTGSEARVTETGSVSATVRDRVSSLLRVANAIEEAGIELAEISVVRPSLDDVFLSLTGAEPTEEDSP